MVFKDDVVCGHGKDWCYKEGVGTRSSGIEDKGKKVILILILIIIVSRSNLVTNSTLPTTESAYVAF